MKHTFLEHKNNIIMLQHKFNLRLPLDHTDTPDIPSPDNFIESRCQTQNTYQILNFSTTLEE